MREEALKFEALQPNADLLIDGERFEEVQLSRDCQVTLQGEVYDLFMEMMPVCVMIHQPNGEVEKHHFRQSAISIGRLDGNVSTLV